MQCYNLVKTFLVINQMAITIRDIAKCAQTSVSAVSLVLNEKWEKKVPKDTVARVKQAIKKYHYVQNPVGRGLALKKKFRISLGIYGSLMEHPLIGAFSFHELLSYVASIISQSGYAIDIIQVNTHHGIKKMCDEIISNGNDGIIFLGWDQKVIKNILHKIERISFPYIVVDCNLNDKSLSYTYTDMSASTEIAITHLIKNGHKRIGFIRAELSKSRFLPKLKGYKMAIKKCGIRFNDRLVADNSNPNPILSGYNACQKVLSLRPKPGAVFCSDNLAALGVLMFLKEKKIKVPDDLELIGYGDLTFANLAIPPLSYVCRSIMEQGKKSVQFILKRMEKKRDNSSQQIRFDEELVIQGTCR